MKRILAPIFLFVLLLPSLAVGIEVQFTELVRRDGIYYKKFTETPFDGDVTGIEQGIIKKGKQIGPWVSYHSNGQLRDKGSYKNGQMYGLWRFYNKRGKLTSERYLQNGKGHGPYRSYYENGKLESKGSYKNGEMNGEIIAFEKTGRVESKTIYKYGKVIQVVIYDKHGKISQKIIREGNKETSCSKRLCGTGSLKNGKRDGLWFFYDEGKLWQKGTYRNGLKHGLETTYRINGKIYFQGKYYKNKKNGEWKFYNLDGSYYASETYISGIRIK